jgi:hypothetical protein
VVYVRERREGSGKTDIWFQHLAIDRERSYGNTSNFTANVSIYTKGPITKHSTGVIKIKCRNHA